MFSPTLASGQMPQPVLIGESLINLICVYEMLVSLMKSPNSTDHLLFPRYILGVESPPVPIPNLYHFVPPCWGPNGDRP